VSALALKVDNDDANGGQQSSVTFDAAAGTAYQIAVDGYDGSVGNITMKVEASSQPSTAKVTAVQVNNGSAQRSRVTGLVVTFANLTALPATPADAFQLKRQSDNAAAATAVYREGMAGAVADVHLQSQPGKRFRGTVVGLGWAVLPEDGTSVMGLPQVEKSIDWVRLAARFPVRIKVENPDESFRIGASAVVTVREQGARSRDGR